MLCGEPILLKIVAVNARFDQVHGDVEVVVGGLVADSGIVPLDEGEFFGEFALLG